MEDPVATPRPPPITFRAGSLATSKDQILSSSPGFGTPAYPLAPRIPRAANPFAVQTTNSASAPSVLPILLPPQTLRPIAFRTLTKKHNLTITSSGLGSLSTFVGKYCGSGWRDEGLAEKVLDEVAKAWKRNGGGVLVEDGADKKLSTLLRGLEPCMDAGRLDTGKLSRTTSATGTSLSRQMSMNLRPEAAREDSQTSIGLSGLDVQDDDLDDVEDFQLSNQDARSYLKMVSAFEQPRLVYNVTKKHLEPVSSSATILPSIQHKTSMFRNRFNLVHQRLLRNEAFQTPSFSAASGGGPLARTGSNVASMQQAYKITPISNLLGRTGSSHLLLGMLVHTSTGDLALTDLSGSIVLDMSAARPVPEDGAWFCPGMIVLIEGTYEEDGSNNSNLGSSAGVGGQIKGRFSVDTIAGPPAERREVTLGTGHDLASGNAHSSDGGGFGWVDFLGVGSEKALGPQMRRVQKSLLKQNTEHARRNIVIVGECQLDIPRTLEALRAILTSYNTPNEPHQFPLSVIFTGNFTSAASLAGSSRGGGSVEYKEQFDGLASALAEFAHLLSRTTLVFVPGDNDPWASSFSAGAASTLPRQSIPELFTSRVRRAIATANTEQGKKDNECAGEAIWASNPARMSLFGPLEEIVLFRDDITGRLRRTAVTFPKLNDHDDEPDDARAPGRATTDESSTEPQEDAHRMDLDVAIAEGGTTVPQPTVIGAAGAASSKVDTTTARKLVKTILDQGHLAPFPASIRPTLWDYAGSLTLYPLPTALVLADAEAPAFAVTYEGCHVMNPGRVLDELGARKGVAKWVEYDIVTHRGRIREIRF